MDVQRRYFSDCVPHIVAHPSDARTFLAKFAGRLGGADDTDVVMVLADILCECLGEEFAEVHRLFTSEGLKGFRDDFAIHIRLRNARTISGIVRQILREHLDLSSEITEINNEESLDRVAGLLISALSVYIERACDIPRTRSTF